MSVEGQEILQNLEAVAAERRKRNADPGRVRAVEPVMDFHHGKSGGIGLR